MQYWVAVNEQKYGPITLDQLLNMNISPDTFVWREGLSTWIKAKDLSELSAIFMQHVVTPPPFVGQEEQATAQPEEETPVDHSQQFAGAPITMPYVDNASNQPQLQKPMMPQNYLVWSIITMLCCCQIFGIIALIYSVQVSSLYSRGDYMGAQDASNKARMWVIISIVAGLIITPIFLAFSMLDEFASSFG